MADEIQRYSQKYDPLEDTHFLKPDPNGEYVIYDTALAMVAAAKREARNEGRREAAELRDKLADVIGAAPTSSIHSALCEYRNAILALMEDTDDERLAFAKHNIPAPDVLEYSDPAKIKKAMPALRNAASHNEMQWVMNAKAVPGAEMSIHGFALRFEARKLERPETGAELDGGVAGRDFYDG